MKTSPPGRLRAGPRAGLGRSAIGDHVPRAGSNTSDDCWYHNPVCRETPPIPPATITIPSLKLAIPAPSRGADMSALFDHIPVAGSYTSVLDRLRGPVGGDESALPPTTITRPSGSSAVTWPPCRSSCIEPEKAQFPVVGSKISDETSVLPPPPAPPNTRTRPSRRLIALWPLRAVRMVPTVDQASLLGSNTSASANTPPPLVAE